MVRTLITGMASYVPGVNALHRRLSRAPGTESSRYCYSVWMRHLIHASNAGLCVCPPRAVAELGPGESIGIGLAALISGAQSYSGFDLIPLTSLQRNLSVFEELVQLFREQADIPGPTEFPEVKPPLDDYSFPHVLLKDADLSDAHIERIRRSICEPARPDSMIRYVAPWWNKSTLAPQSVGMIFSQAVLEHIDNLDHAYHTMRSWLVPGGFISHQVDLRSHATSSTWDGHRQYGDIKWALIRGKRPYLINRAPYSAHRAHLISAGFEIKKEILASSQPTLDLSKLCSKFRGLSEVDLTTSGFYVLASTA